MTIHMNMKNVSLVGFAFLLVSAIPAFSQQLIPTPGCTTTPAQLAATKKAAMDELHTPGEAKFNFIDKSYIQHNPARMKTAKENKLSDYEELRKDFLTPPAAPAAGTTSGAAAVPKPPPGDTTEIVTAECDIVTIVRNTFRQDPTASPGTFFEAFTFDTYRIKDGKVVEHWDGNLINPPAAGRRGQ